MKNTRKLSSGKELYESIIIEALKNDLFKKQLIDKPRKTINKYANGEFYLSDEIKVVVDDQSDQSLIYLNIPAKIDIDELELTDEELNHVAGGGTTWSLLSGLICLGYQVAKALDDCGCPK